MTDRKKFDAVQYVVVNNPFFDGVQLHEPGARILWAGPPGASLHPADAPRRKSTHEAPLFLDPLKGRGDGMNVETARPGQPTILVQ